MAWYSFSWKWILATVIRFVHIFPNNDPILALALPSAKKNLVPAILFAFLCMFSFDFFAGKFGVWTIITSLTYAGVILVLGLFFSKIKILSLKHYFFAGIFGVLLFDTITGPLMSTFIFRQSFLVTVLGQIPFTMYHLASVSSYVTFFAIVLDPVVRSQLVKGRVPQLFFSGFSRFCAQINRLF
ncbi:MAG: hypothetical protein NTY48_04785 [Candidatus Diapherotrites archaeon]|nr:hypothetical protein [Candidatus Diapherotrites archaeon]